MPVSVKLKLDFGQNRSEKFLFDIVTEAIKFVEVSFDWLLYSH